MLADLFRIFLNISYFGIDSAGRHWILRLYNRDQTNTVLPCPVYPPTTTTNPRNDSAKMKSGKDVAFAKQAGQDGCHTMATR